MSIDIDKFAERIKGYCERHSQAKLARALASVDIAPGTVHRWAIGESVPQERTAKDAEPVLAELEAKEKIHGICKRDKAND